LLFASLKGVSVTQENSAMRPEQVISDWYLFREDPFKGFVFPGSVAIKDHPGLFEAAALLQKKCLERSAIDFRVSMPGSKPGEQEDFRVHLIKRLGEHVFALRRIAKRIPTLEELGVETAIRQLLLHKNLGKGGLVIVGGETGQGKTTTCAATVKERMEAFGSFCLTIEDPAELPLDGCHGKGRCIQTEVENHNWAEAMTGAMRSYPSVSGSMLYVGETRDADTAAEVVRIANNGHLVLTTVHADGLDSIVQRYMSMASAAMSTEKEVQTLMASCFRLAIHQSLEDEVVKNVSKKSLKANFLFSPNGQSPVAHKLRSGGESLNNEITQQRMVLRNKGAAGIVGMWAH